MKTMKKITVLGMALFLIMGLCGCKKAMMQIDDNGVVTEIEVSVPETVEEILADAEIVLKDGDEISPSLETEISDAEKIVISRKHTVSLTIDGGTKEVTMAGGTIRDLLKKEGITLGEKQHVNYDLDEYLKEGMEVKIVNQFSVEVQCDGKTQNLDTEAATVGDVLTELEITLGEDDRVAPALTESVTDGMQITVKRITFETLTETETIEYETAYEDDSSMAKGKEEVRTEGENGEKEITYKVTYVDGVEKSREVSGETVTKEPVNKVVKVGTKENSVPVPTPESTPASTERSVVSKKAFYDCDGSGHGYYEITYSDGSVEYEEF